MGKTQSNERSSRSHSVFTLRLSGSNALTGEKCDGILNLIDLAGSERLSQSVRRAWASQRPAAGGLFNAC